MSVFHASNPFMDKINSLCGLVSLTDEQYEELSRRAEHELKNDRSLYTRKVVFLALLGYAFIFSIVTLLLLVGYWLIQLCIHAHLHYGGLKLLILVLIPIWVIAKSLWVKIPEPEGIVATRAGSPELFELVDELSKKLNTRVDKVLLNEDFNAAVVQVPRFGILGMHKNILLLGLPLMLTQRPLGFKAILAHELGHLCGNHSKSSAWIYKLRVRWGQMLSRLSAEGSWFYTLFLIFFSWFSPRFSAYSQAMARAHELEADAEAARIVGVEHFSESMLLLPVYEKFMGEKFWPDVMGEVKVAAQPPEAIYSRLVSSAASARSEGADLKTIMREALMEKGSGADTHPPLMVRLTGGHFTPNIKIGEDFSLEPDILERLSQPISTEESAAFKYLGRGVMDATIEQLDREWRDKCTAGWIQQHERLLEAKRALEDLHKKEAEGELTADEYKLRAFLTLETEDAEAGIRAYTELIEKFPEDANPKYNLGMLLLKDDFERGLELLQEAVTLKPTLLADTCPTLLPMLKAKGRLEEAAVLEEKLAAYYKVAAVARKERNNVSGESVLEPHGMSKDDIEYLVNVFKELPTIKEAYLVRKFVRHFPECPYLVLALEIKTQSIGTQSSEEKQALAQWLVGNLQLKYEFCVSVFDMYSGKLKTNIIAVEDSLIYRKPNG